MYINKIQIYWQVFSSNEHLQASAFIQYHETSTNIQDNLQMMYIDKMQKIGKHSQASAKISLCT